MRKGIKIKAYVIFLCWLMIFGHSIIPHNHAETDSFIIHGSKHYCSVHQTGTNNSTEFNSCCPDGGICRVSGFLYHQLSQDNLFLPSARDYHYSLFLQKGLFIFNREQNVYINKFFGSASLRSPPVV